MEDSGEQTNAPPRGAARVEVGCQGWNYDDWVTPAGRPKAVFYPRGTRAERMLDAYTRAFETVEVDSTFYAVPSASTVEGWRRRAPEGFTFSLKLPREITHEQALRGEASERVLSEFCERARLLGDKLSAVLVQLPPQFEATKENFRALNEFLPRLPNDVRFAFEFRDPFWFDEEPLEIFTRHPHVSLALIEGPWVTRGRVWRAAEKILHATDFAYVRFMGARDLTRFDIVQRPQELNLDKWSTAIEQLARRVPRVYVYFSNFYEGFAPASANKLKRLLGQEIVEPDELENQPSLF